MHIFIVWWIWSHNSDFLDGWYWRLGLQEQSTQYEDTLQNSRLDIQTNRCVNCNTEL